MYYKIKKLPFLRKKVKKSAKCTRLWRKKLLYQIKGIRVVLFSIYMEASFYSNPSDSSFEKKIKHKWYCLLFLYKKT